MMRLDRMLANARVGSRSQVKKIVKAGRVTVNGETAPSSDIRIDENNDVICLDGQPVLYEKYVYYMLNKPEGYISATEGRGPTVMDLIYEDYKGMFPCGRLDKDTTGLLLITNDGPLAHLLLSPKHHVDKEYEIEMEHPLSPDDIQKIESGLTFEGIAYKPASYIRVDDMHCHLVLHEGKYHEIKNLFKALDNHVEKLKRLRMKNLVLDEHLEPGEYRPLTKEEIGDLRNEES
jgi:16S rRNA pseudouridine516 synthase